MVDFRFGDILRYPLTEDPDPTPNWVFMFLTAGQRYINVMVVQAHPNDDQWYPGDIIGAGKYELVLI